MIRTFTIDDGVAVEEYMIDGDIGNHLALLIRQVSSEQMDDPEKKARFTIFIAEKRRG